ncbi:hypothetical protein VE25_14255 [Devosia geojensis]|uniref:Lipoprotein n=1 Tax=Devosia geojensis TaxID=443610 RepID=A0A0F5FRI9_9HYPH|nr:hypothetical protein [Devosia geojensis]KKB11175.1 hypothetical protein VE25_14255 [Devosia geojensis]
MPFSAIVSAGTRGLVAGLAGLALAGCSMGSMFGGGGASTADVNLVNATPSQQQIAQAQASAMPAIATECPPIRVRNGGEAMFRYAGGQVNPNQLQYQGVIDEVTRNCTVSNGQIRVNMGASGRVLLGPAGSQTSVTAPVRFAVERDGQAVFTEKYNLSVPITGQSGQFVQVVENVSIPYVGGESITIWVGFDTRS